MGRLVRRGLKRRRLLWWRLLRRWLLLLLVRRRWRDLRLGATLARHGPHGSAILIASTLAWRIPWTEEPSRLQSIGLQRVEHN